jgi:hypothetical protein
VYKRENKWKKEGGKLERGRKNMEMGNDLNKTIQGLLQATNIIFIL